MTIPEIAARLRALSVELGAPELADLATGLKRRRMAPRRDRQVSQPMTPWLQARIRNWAAMHPEWTHKEIADKFNVVGGRVSEALYGKRS